MPDNILRLSALPLTAAVALAQIPAPAPESRTAPRAEYIVTAGVGGAVPVNRHWSQAAGNQTSLFVFAGRTGESGSGTRRNDLFEFDATTLLWTQHNADGDPTAPPQRMANALAWDWANSQLVMFGGQDPVGTALGDTWTWDPATGAWTNVTPATSPSARRFVSMSYDPASTGIILFGGSDAGGTVLSDTWMFIGNSWIPLSPATTPPARQNHTILTRRDFGDVLMCSGHDTLATGRTHHLDVWTWSGTTLDWTLVTPTTSAVPHTMTGHQAVYDELRQVVVITGGNGISSASANTGGAYGTQYGGSPSSWTSEFDCITNEWRLRGPAAFGTADPIIGRASRYYSAFLPATGKIYKWGGQNPSGVGVARTVMKEYQATPVADAQSYGSGCNGLSMSADNAPWLGRNWNATATGLGAGSLAFGVLGFSQVNVPVGGGCTVVADDDSVSFLANIGGSAGMSLPLPLEPAFVGIPLNAQVVELAAGGIFASNGLAITLGAL